MIKIRIATIKDADEIAAMHVLLYDYYASITPLVKNGRNMAAYLKKQIREKLKNKNSRTLVALEGKRFVGCMTASIDVAPMYLKSKRLGELSRVYIKRGFRKLGIAKMMARDLERWLKHKGANRVHLTVYSKNKGAIKAWERLGFKERYIGMMLDL